MALAAVLAAAPFVLTTPGHAESAGPSPLPQPDEYRTRPFAGPIRPLLPVTQDLAGMATTEIGARRVSARLDANLAFGKDSAVLRPAAHRHLSELATVLASRPPGTVEIMGHTDDLGSAQHGYDLSRRRANAVRNRLGPALAKHQVIIQGRGEDEPLVENRDEASRARNRRVELSYRAPS
ncbi:OmpA family protein [Luteococcus sp. Sow4_B9]|uniref:OmpA family protein n=1 Tax=Luteococcus sp. Sow4_B9 TaxID=3438792 RepID=UPI003F9C101D